MFSVRFTNCSLPNYEAFNFKVDSTAEVKRKEENGTDYGLLSVPEEQEVIYVDSKGRL